MKESEIERIPIAEIRVVNPRSRNKTKFQEIVDNIAAVGLKKPISVHRRELEADGTRYDLIYGQGRMEAFRALGETTIPAIMSDASREERLLMSLVENIARRPPSNSDLLREVKNLRERNYTADEIAQKLGRDKSYVRSIVNLVENGEAELVKAVEAGRLPISVATNIATGNDRDVQQAMTEAYEKGDLRGDKFRNARRFITQRIAKLRKEGKLAQTRRKLTGDAVVREYKDRIRQQRNLLKKANRTKECLLLLTTAMRGLLADEHFVTLLRAENLFDMPEQLASRIR